MQSPVIFEVYPCRPHLFGAGDGQRDMENVVAQSIANPGRDVIVALNLSGVVSISGSYLRATVLWALLCGQAEVRRDPTNNLTDKWSLRPLPFFPIVTNCSKEIADEAHDFFSQRNLPILRMHGSLPIKKAMVLGRLDGFLASTLHTLCQLGQATAAELAMKSSEKITVNGWSNRLADLYLMRLVVRQRSGKYWIYSPISRDIIPWD